MAEQGVIGIFRQLYLLYPNVLLITNSYVNGAGALLIVAFAPGAPGDGNAKSRAALF